MFQIFLVLLTIVFLHSEKTSKFAIIRSAAPISSFTRNMKKILAEILVEALLLLEMFAIIQAFSPKYVSVLDRGYPMPDLKIRDALVTNLASGVVRSLAPSNSEIHPSFRGLDTKTSLGSETYLIEKARRQECGYCRTNMTRGMAGEIQVWA